MTLLDLRLLQPGRLRDVARDRAAAALRRVHKLRDRRDDPAAADHTGRAAPGSGLRHDALTAFGLGPSRADSAPPIVAALAQLRHVVLGVAVLSGAVNLLALAGSFYMLEVYDRVIPSRSVPTLVGLSLIVLVLYLGQGFFDLIRSRLLLRAGRAFDEALSRRVFRAVVTLPLRGRAEADELRPIRDLDQIRGALSGGGPGALFDLPWVPVYLALLFAFHVWIGLTALLGALALVGLTALAEILTRHHARDAREASAARGFVAEASRRNAETVRAMGMEPDLAGLWARVNAASHATQERTAEITGAIHNAAKVLRVVLQSAVLGVGAFLVIRQEATAGIIIAGSILSARALGPIDQAIGYWKTFSAARECWRHLGAALAAAGEEPDGVTLPAPREALIVEQASVGPPGGQRLTALDIGLTLKGGQGLGIVGHSASGKSSLARLIVGIWPPARGAVRLDGARLDQWRPQDLGRHVGYLPQEVELFPGTVAANIARFRPGAEAQGIIAAARAARVHDLILSLPDGYQTQIGERGALLSAGQRQRLALARALYGDPFLVVLDEPNANLDQEGEAALTEAIAGVRARGGIVVVIAHRPSALAAVDQVMVMANGRVQALGPRDEVLPTLGRPRAMPAAPTAGFAAGFAPVTLRAAQGGSPR
nr:type I secretion system permease/ATPase [Methylobacterium nonmethylotrophicum]